MASAKMMPEVTRKTGAEYMSTMGSRSDRVISSKIQMRLTKISVPRTKLRLRSPAFLDEVLPRA